MKKTGYWAAAGLGLALAIGGTLPAFACGGFFCQLLPIDQAGERIVFAKDSEDVSVIVQIVYAGSAKDFAWILPACTSRPAVPKLAPGPDSLFQGLDPPTRPQFQLDPLTVEGTCKQAGIPGGGPEVFAAAPLPTPIPAADVQVVARENVGPYDSAILKSDDSQALRKWLQENGYNVPDNLDPLISTYVALKAYFIALKLRPDRDTGDLQPIIVTYPAAKPMIPIRLTAVAAQPDMGVLVYMLGNARAIPQNFLHVKINEGLIDWPSGGANYNQVVTAAVNEARGGRALVTDYAGPSSIVRDSLPPDQYDIGHLKTLTDPALFVDTMLNQGFPRSTQVQNIIKRYVPIPASLQGQVSEQQFYNSLASYSSQLRSQPFDPVAFAKELDELIVTPYRRSRELFTRLPYLTRFYTTISPAEMTEDPVFSYNPDLPQVSRVHKAKGTILCNPDIFQSDAPIRVTLENGQTLLQKPSFGPITILPFPGAIGPAAGPSPSSLPGGVPAAAVVEQLQESGPPITVKDNSRAIASQPSPSIPPTSSRSTPAGMGCAGCSNPSSRLAGNPSEVIFLGSLASGLGGLRRWRKWR